MKPPVRHLKPVVLASSLLALCSALMPLIGRTADFDKGLEDYYINERKEALKNLKEIAETLSNEKTGPEAEIIKRWAESNPALAFRIYQKLFPQADLKTGPEELVTDPPDFHGGDLSSLRTQLQQALNTSGGEALSGLLSGEYASDLERRFRIFSARFPDARWSVKQANPLLDGRPTFEVVVSGTLNSGGLTYALEASQRLVLQSEGKRIIGEEVISEQSILSSASKPLPISLLIPDAVLTGSRYDVDVVLDRPLGNAMVAGGLIGLTPVQVSLQSTPEIQLSPMHGGGLFKSVQAPFTPGSQTWAVMLVHPDGLITVTKRVRVVRNEEELTL